MSVNIFKALKKKIIKSFKIPPKKTKTRFNIVSYTSLFQNCWFRIIVGQEKNKTKFETKQNKLLPWNINNNKPVVYFTCLSLKSCTWKNVLWVCWGKREKQQQKEKSSRPSWEACLRRATEPRTPAILCHLVRDESVFLSSGLQVLPLLCNWREQPFFH